MLAPVAGTVVFIFGVVRYLLRSLYDCVMYLFVLCLARVPASDNKIAWRVSGPH